MLRRRLLLLLLLLLLVALVMVLLALVVVVLLLLLLLLLQVLLEMVVVRLLLLLFTPVCRPLNCTGLPCAHEIKANGMSFTADDVPQRYHKAYAASTDPSVFLNGPADPGGTLQTAALPLPSGVRMRPLRPGRGGNWCAALPEPVHECVDDDGTGGGGDDDGRDDDGDQGGGGDDSGDRNEEHSADAMTLAKKVTRLPTAWATAFAQQEILRATRRAEATIAAASSDETALDCRDLLRQITGRVQSDKQWLGEWRHALEERVPRDVRLPGDDSRESVLAIADMALLYAQDTGQVPDLLRDAEDFDRRLSSARLTPVNRLERHAAKVMPGRKRGRREKE
jgi:hypothetical protein